MVGHPWGTQSCLCPTSSSQRCSETLFPHLTPFTKIYSEKNKITTNLIKIFNCILFSFLESGSILSCNLQNRMNGPMSSAEGVGFIGRKELKEAETNRKQMGHCKSILCRIKMGSASLECWLRGMPPVLVPGNPLFSRKLACASVRFDSMSVGTSESIHVGAAWSAAAFVQTMVSHVFV